MPRIRKLVPSSWPPPIIIIEPRSYLADNAIDQGYLFPGRSSGHISTRQIQMVLNSLAEKAGLRVIKHKDKADRDRHRVTSRLLRHSFAIWRLDSDVPIYYLKEQLGLLNPDSHDSLRTR
jgi:integrase